MDYIAGIIVKIEMLLDTIRGSKVGIYVLELMESSGVRVTGPGVRGGAEDGELKVKSNVNAGIISNDKINVGVSIMKNKGGQSSNKWKKNARKK
jgi:hypothetical protein